MASIGVSASQDLIAAAASSVNDSVACYCVGTLILTQEGEVPVELLSIGDRVVTLSGEAEPIRWIGRRSYSVRFLRPAQRPIIFRKGSLGEGIPKRDLRVSPGHAMLVGGLLVPAAALTNGSTIVRDRDCRRVDYLHVELAEHRVIWAEGAPSETFVDDDNRMMFQNAGEYAWLYPGITKHKGFCAPRVEGGYLLEVIRRGLARRAKAPVGVMHQI